MFHPSLTFQCNTISQEIGILHQSHCQMGGRVYFSIPITPRAGQVLWLSKPVMERTLSVSHNRHYPLYRMRGRSVCFVGSLRILKCIVYQMFDPKENLPNPIPSPRCAGGHSYSLGWHHVVRHFSMLQHVCYAYYWDNKRVVAAWTSKVDIWFHGWCYSDTFSEWCHRKTWSTGWKYVYTGYTTFLTNGFRKIRRMHVHKSRPWRFNFSARIVFNDILISLTT